MKSQIKTICESFLASTMGADELLSTLRTLDIPAEDVVVNREDDEPKLEVIIFEDEVAFSHSLTEEQAQALVTAGASEV